MGLIRSLDNGEIYDDFASEPAEEPEFSAFLSLQTVLEPIGANPYGESLDEFLTRAQRHYYARTSMLLALGSQHAATPPAQGGTAPRRSRRAEGKPSLEDHCMWLALYQVEGMDMTEVARRVHQDRTTVSKAVHALAKVLEITLRVSRPGRRPSLPN